MNKLSVAVALSVAAGAWSASAGAVVVDSFDDGTYSSGDIFSSSGTVTGTQSGSSPIGGSRTVSGNTNGGRFNIEINPVFDPGRFDASNTVGSNGVASILWDGNAGAGLGGQDFTDGGASLGIYLAFPAAINNDLAVSFNVNGGSTSTIIFPSGSQGDSFFFPFSGFTNPAVFSSVNSIQMQLSSSTAWDASIDFVDTRTTPVPVPAAFWLMGSALIGMVRMARNSRKA